MLARANFRKELFRNYVCFDQRLLCSNYTIIDYTSSSFQFYGEKYNLNGVSEVSLGEFPAYCFFNSDLIECAATEFLTNIFAQCSTGSIVSNRDISDLLLTKQVPFKSKKYATFEVDLTKTSSEIWSTYRKSFRSLINKGLRDSDVQIYIGEKIDKQLRLKLRSLHFRSAKRRTRSFGKWNAQFAQIENNNAMLVCVYDGLTIINYSIFSMLGDVAYYQTGVNNPLTHVQYGSHVAIHSAIIALKKRQFKIAILSQHPETDLSPKETSILNFKKGLARVKREYLEFTW